MQFSAKRTYIFWKRRFRLKNASNVFRPHDAGEIQNRNNNHDRSFWICVWGKLGQGNHVINVKPSGFKKAPFPKSHKNEKPAFSTPPVKRAVPKSFVSGRRSNVEAEACLGLTFLKDGFQPTWNQRFMMITVYYLSLIEFFVIRFTFIDRVAAEK